MMVKAAPGLKVPKEGKPGKYITDTDAEDMPDSHYYKALLADGSLVEDKATAKKK